jgi:hypothetical protein
VNRAKNTAGWKDGNNKFDSTLLRNWPKRRINDSIGTLLQKMRPEMFRLIMMSAITLRVILCPFFCAVGNVDVCALGGETGVPCTCSASHDEPYQSDDSSAPWPCESPVPCDVDCVGHVAPELNNRTAVSIELSLNFVTVCFNTTDVMNVFMSRCEEHSHRHDLPDGRSIRLVCASLLL